MKKSILIVDDNREIVESFKGILELKGYTVDTATTGQEAIDKAANRFFNLALLDIKLPDMEGTQLLKLLRNMERASSSTPRTVKIMVTGHADQKNAMDSLNFGADAYLMKPVSIERLIQVVRDRLRAEDLGSYLSHTRAEDRHARTTRARDRAVLGMKKSILVVDDDEAIRVSSRVLLEGIGYLVETATTGEEAIKKCRHQHFDLALIDIKLPDMEGTELLSALDLGKPRTRTIMISGHPQLDNTVRSLNRGADAYIVKPIDPQNLLRIVQEKLRDLDAEYCRSAGSAKEILRTDNIAPRE